jgi:hypothetical protein
VGRERIVPVSLLPPLRVETILLLASVKENELGQSYERNHFFAGRTSQGLDWAPIYLSDALIDTEYGSLLNITDQLLKSWSAYGQKEYVNFRYPKPDKFPFPKPLIEYAKADAVTYNWNTKGAGYSVKMRGYDVFAWNRTGALPVDYLGESNAELRAAEETGYSYFASLNDPNLARVVQYAEMYQIFRHYGITAAPRKASFHLGAPQEYHDALLRMLLRLHELDSGRLDLSDWRKSDVQLFRAVKAETDRLFDEEGTQALRDLADAIAAPRLFQKTHEANSQTGRLLNVESAMSSLSELLLELTNLTRDEAMQIYARSTRRAQRGWIYTPSVLESWGTGSSASTTGGHDLDSAITRFRESTEIEPGQLKILEENNERVVLYNHSDGDKVGETVRTAAREKGTAEEVQAKLNSVLSQSHEDTRALAEVLQYPVGRQSVTGRGLEANHIPAAIRRTGWWQHAGSLGPKETHLLSALNSDGSHAIVVERTLEGRYLLFDGPSKRILQADNQPAAIDAMIAYAGPGKGPVRVHLRGFDARSAHGFTQSADLQLAGFGEAPEIRAPWMPQKSIPRNSRFCSRNATISAKSPSKRFRPRSLLRKAKWQSMWTPKSR